MFPLEARIIVIMHKYSLPTLRNRRSDASQYPYFCGEVALKIGWRLEMTDPWNQHRILDQLPLRRTKGIKKSRSEGSHGQIDRSGEQVPERAERFY